MPVQLNCPQCRAQFSLPDALLGRDVRCTRCQRVFRAEAPKQAEEALPEVIPVLAPAVETTAPIPQAIQSEPTLRRRPGPVPPSRKNTTPVAPHQQGSPQVWILWGGVASVVLIAGVVVAWIVSSSTPEPAPPPDRMAANEVRPGEQPMAGRDQRPPRERVEERPPQDQFNQRPDNQPQKPVIPLVARIDLPPLPDPVEIKPAPVKEERSVKLPEQAGALRVGGGGRFLILHSPRCGSSASSTPIQQRSSATSQSRKTTSSSPEE